MRAIFVVLLALSSTGCNLFGPSRSVDGEWVGQLGKFSFVCLTLRQDSAEDIVGRYGTGDIRFERDDRNVCGEAKTVP